MSRLLVALNLLVDELSADGVEIPELSVFLFHVYSGEDESSFSVACMDELKICLLKPYPDLKVNSPADSPSLLD